MGNLLATTPRLDHNGQDSVDYLNVKSSRPAPCRRCDGIELALIRRLPASGSATTFERTREGLAIVPPQTPTLDSTTRCCTGGPSPRKPALPRQSPLPNPHVAPRTTIGRGDRIRTCDIRLPKPARYQLRYAPHSLTASGRGGGDTTTFDDLRLPACEMIAERRGQRRERRRAV
jgi:hypothetical protein